MNYLVHFVTGTYGIKPPLPAVGGNEGVGEVTEVGSEVKSLRAGDQVVLRADLSLGIKWISACHLYMNSIESVWT